MPRDTKYLIVGAAVIAACAWLGGILTGLALSTLLPF